MDVTKACRRGAMACILILGLMSMTANAYWVHHRTYTNCHNGYCTHFQSERVCANGHCWYHWSRHNWYR
jgi:hypothetical protein